MGKNASKNKYVEIFDAASQDDLSGVKFFVEKKHVSVDTLNIHHQTAAHVAVSRGHLNILQYLLSKNPFLVFVEDDKGETVFQIALKRGFLNIVEFLAHQFKSDLLKRTAQGQTPLQLAAENGNLHVVQYLIDKLGVDVLETASNVTSDTVIHTAARCGHLNIVGYLLEEKNVNVDLLNGRGQSSAFSATIGNHSNIVRYLVEEHRANVTIIDRNRNTILHHAFANENLLVPRYLLDEKKIPIDVNASNEQGETLILLAIEQRNMKLLKYIVNEREARLDVPDKYGDYPLHKAAKTNNLDIVMCLVAHGANPAVRNFYGKTPLEVAQLHNKYLQHGLHSQFLGYLELITPRRRRRSLSSTTVLSPTLAAYPYRILADPNTSIQLRGRGGGESNFALRAPFKQLNNFLTLVESIRWVTKSRYQRIENDTLSSPTEIVERQFDPLALNSIEAEFEESSNTLSRF